MRENQVALAARNRTISGKKVRFLRRQGWLPANVFGPGAPSQSIEISTREIEHLLTHVPRSTLFSLKVDGDADTTVLVRSVQRKPTTGELYHVDFYRVSMTHALKTEVPLFFEGEAPAAREADAVILQAMTALPVECLPSDIPAQIPVPLERLAAIDDSIRVGDLQLPRGVKALVDENELVARALAPTVPEVEAAPEEAAAEPTEGEAEAGEAAAESEPSAEAEGEAS